MAMCNDCPYYNKCDYAGEAWEGSDREVVGCKKDIERKIEIANNVVEHYKRLFPATANGEALDRLALERGITRQQGETDDELRERLKGFYNG